MGLPAPARHALLALGEFAAARGPLGVEEAARRLDLPAAALSKIFQRLARAGVVSSRRGPGGGYALTREPARVPLWEVVSALQDAPGSPPRCLLENRECGEGGTCALHAASRRADGALRDALQSLSVADLARARRAP